MILDSDIRTAIGITPSLETTNEYKTASASRSMTGAAVKAVNPRSNNQQGILDKYSTY
jgi:hypothetical protein